MALALYRKHRPRSLDQVVGQDYIKATLKALLSQLEAESSEQAPHAFLFTGPRGVGKTSVARILAYGLNGLTYEGQVDPLDIVEIDAASHNKVAQIRDLIEKAAIAPTSLRYKIYIIDEVHALAASEVSFQAFLKTLEEPPGHVIFILATTEFNKIPATIVSRCQRFAFRQIEPVALVEALSRIAVTEQIQLTTSGAELIARHSLGSLRDAISLLDQLAVLQKTVDGDLVRQSLGLPEFEQLQALIDQARAGDIAAVIAGLRQLLFQSSSSPKSIADELANLIRAQMSQSKQPQADIDCLDDLLEVNRALAPEINLEIALIKRARAGGSVSLQQS